MNILGYKYGILIVLGVEDPKIGLNPKKYRSLPFCKVLPENS